MTLLRKFLLLAICLLSFAKPVFASVLVESTKTVKIGGKTFAISYESDVITKQVRRVTIHHEKVTDIFEDIHGNGYFGSHLFFSENLKVHFFNLYHGQYQNVEVTRRLEKGSAIATLYFDKKSNQYRPLLKRFEPFRKLGYSVEEVFQYEQNIEQNCHISSVPGMPSAKTLQDIMSGIAASGEDAEVKKVEALGLIDDSCKQGKFKNYYNDIAHAIALIRISDKAPFNPPNYLSCLESASHKMNDTAAEIMKRLNDPKAPKITCVNDPSKQNVIGEYNEQTKHVEIYWAPTDESVSNQTLTYGDVLFHEHIHTTGISDETRTRAIETCCSAADPADRAEKCKVMDDFTFREHRLVSYGSAFQDLPGFAHAWQEFSFGRSNDAAREMLFDSFLQKVQNLSVADESRIKACLASAQGKESSCFVGFDEVCKSTVLNTVLRQTECTSRASDLAKVLGDAMNTSCQADSGKAESCFLASLEKAKAMNEGTAPKGSESFFQLTQLQNFSDLEAASSFSQALSGNAAYSKLLEEITNAESKAAEPLKSRPISGVGEQINFNLARQIRLLEERLNAKGDYLKCVGDGVPSQAKVTECLSPAKNILGAVKLYQQCLSEKSMNDSLCSAIAQQQLKIEVDNYFTEKTQDLNDVTRKSTYLTSRCEMELMASNKQESCRNFYTGISSIFSDLSSKCTPKGSFACLAKILDPGHFAISGTINQKASGINKIDTREMHLYSMLYGLRSTYPNFENAFAGVIDMVNPDHTHGIMDRYFGQLLQTASYPDLKYNLDVFDSCKFAASPEVVEKCNDDAYKGFVDFTNTYFGGTACTREFLGSVDPTNGNMIVNESDAGKQCRIIGDKVLNFFATSSGHYIDPDTKKQVECSPNSKLKFECIRAFLNSERNSEPVILKWQMEGHSCKDAGSEHAPHEVKEACLEEMPRTWTDAELKSHLENTDAYAQKYPNAIQPGSVMRLMGPSPKSLDTIISQAPGATIPGSLPVNSFSFNPNSQQGINAARAQALQAVDASTPGITTLAANATRDITNNVVGVPTAYAEETKPKPDSDKMDDKKPDPAEVGSDGHSAGYFGDSSPTPHTTDPAIRPPSQPVKPKPSGFQADALSADSSPQPFVSPDLKAPSYNMPQNTSPNDSSLGIADSRNSISLGQQKNTDASPVNTATGLGASAAQPGGRAEESPTRNPTSQEIVPVGTNSSDVGGEQSQAGLSKKEIVELATGNRELFLKKLKDPNFVANLKAAKILVKFGDQFKGLLEADTILELDENNNFQLVSTKASK